MSQSPLSFLPSPLFSLLLPPSIPPSLPTSLHPTLPPTSLPTSGCTNMSQSLLEEAGSPCTLLHEPLPIITTSTTSTSNPLPPQVKLKPTSYSAVNILGLLPEELRTRENLEGGRPEDQQEEFMQHYLKKQQKKQCMEQEMKC